VLIDCESAQELIFVVAGERIGIWGHVDASLSEPRAALRFARKSGPKAAGGWEGIGDASVRLKVYRRQKGTPHI